MRRHAAAPQISRSGARPVVLLLLCALLAAYAVSALVAIPARLPALQERVRVGPMPAAATATPIAKPQPSPTPAAGAAAAPTIDFATREFETGVAFPRWGSAGYGDSDSGWHTGLCEIQQQTGAGWIELMIQLYQDSPTSTYVHAGWATPSPQNLAAGIRSAHAMGRRVFVVPLLGVLHGQPWGGAIHFGSYAQAHAWFAGYWRALQPYLAAAAEAGAEQFAIGTELSGLESADGNLWASLIASAHATFAGKLTYDINWSTLGAEPRGWMRDPRLAYLGVSEYAPIAGGPWRLSAEQIAGTWQQWLLPSLQGLSAAAGKPVIISEIGYRNARDTLYRPWDHSSHASQDPELQASAYNQALRAVFAAPDIAGIFFWAWSVDAFAPNNLPAAKVLWTYYSYYLHVDRQRQHPRRDPRTRARDPGS